MSIPIGKPSPLVEITRGRCHAVYAFEIGMSVDLEECRRILAAGHRQSVRDRRRAPQYFQYRPAPIRIPYDVEIEILPGWSTRAMEVVLYDFGAASLSYEIPIVGSLAGLVELSAAINEGQTLPADARTRLERLLKEAGQAIQRPRIADVAEDYMIFQIETFASPMPPATLLGDHGPLLASILRSEKQALSQDEVADATAVRLSFSEGDVAVIDWNAALVFDPEGDEARAVLEFANVQLLEMRWLDQELDDALERAYDVLTRHQGGLRLGTRSHVANMRAIGTLQVDSAVLFERVTNALKLVGDQYLSRLYRMVSQRFHLRDWDSAITRKLQTLDGIYQKLADRGAAQRMEALEWIIILLFAISIILQLLPAVSGH